MLLLTRLPDRPGPDRRRPRSRSSATCPASPRARCGPPSACPSPRPGATSWACGPGPCPTPTATGGWVLNGTKCWMSGVREADWYTVFAKTGDPTSRAHDSITAFIVERAWDGVVGRVDRPQDGRARRRHRRARARRRPGPGRERHRRGGRLPAGHARAQLDAPDRGRPGHRPGRGRAHVRHRVRASSAQAFGKTIADFQGIQWEIAKCAVDIEAARLLTYRAAWLADQGKFTKEYVPFLSMAKYHATELAVRASGLAVQLLGRGRLHGGPPDRAVVPRRQAAHHRGGDLARSSSGLIARGVLDHDLWWD